MNNASAIGIDIGGSHISGALVNLKTRSIIENTGIRIRVNSKSTIEEITDSWINAIQQLIQRNNLHQPKIGIAMPAPFD